MNKARLQYLCNQFLRGIHSDEELAEFMAVLNDPEYDEQIHAIFGDIWNNLSESELIDLNSQKANAIFDQIAATPQTTSNLWYTWLKVAASVLLICSVGLYFYKANKQTTAVPVQIAKVHDIPAGGNNAVLTLANGKRIVLNDKKQGQLVSQQGVSVHKTGSGQIEYIINNSDSATQAIVFNTLSTPKGGQYQVVLPDGTRVYLNSASSLTYPTRFAGNQRAVTMSGEVYFEVAKNAHMPFKVNVANQQQVEVLGTHFNIAAYNDEDEIKTTLLEGSVRLSNSSFKTLLVPGQMATQNLASKKLGVEKADIDEVMSWREGYFIFSNESITTIMKKISRWYDIDVAYQGDVTGINFLGNYSRSKSLSNLLQTLSLSGKIHFKIEGRRVTVIKN